MSSRVLQSKEALYTFSFLDALAASGFLHGFDWFRTFYLYTVIVYRYRLNEFFLVFSFHSSLSLSHFLPLSLSLSLALPAYKALRSQGDARDNNVMVLLLLDFGVLTAPAEVRHIRMLGELVMLGRRVSLYEVSRLPALLNLLCFFPLLLVSIAFVSVTLSLVSRHTTGLAIWEDQGTSQLAELREEGVQMTASLAQA